MSFDKLAAFEEEEKSVSNASGEKGERDGEREKERDGHTSILDGRVIKDNNIGQIHAIPLK